MQVIEKAYADLGFGVLEDEALKQMLLAPIVKLSSKEATIGALKRLGVPHVSVRTLYASLARCAQRSYRDRIAAACFAHAAKRGDLSLVLYDVTTLYFVAEKEDETWEANQGFRRIGYSKERRVDPLIILGLLVDREGNPIEVEAFERNMAETHTLLPLVRRLQERHGLHDFVAVADPGMLSAANLKASDEPGFYFNCRCQTNQSTPRPRTLLKPARGLHGRSANHRPAQPQPGRQRHRKPQ